MLADAIKLAEWIGDGKELTSDGFLHSDLVAPACELLGVELPEDDESESLDVVWEAALDAGFISVDEELVKAVDLPTDPNEVLCAWLSLALDPFGIPDGPCPEHVTVLAVLADAREPVSVLALMEEVMSDFPSDDGEDHDDDDDRPRDRRGVRPARARRDQYHRARPSRKAHDVAHAARPDARRHSVHRAHPGP